MNYLEFIAVLFFAVGFFFPGCLCCGTPCGTVSGVCSSTPASITVTATGFSNNGCSACADYNATWIVNRNTNITIFPSECYWERLETTKGCRVVPNVDQVAAFFDDVAGDVELTIQIGINVALGVPRNIQLWKTNLGALPVACEGFGTFAVPFDSTIIDTACTHDGSDLTVTI